MIPSCSVLIPVKSGGELLLRTVRRVREQTLSRPAEILLADSGSPDAEVERLRELGAAVLPVEPSSFDHGATRDLLARRASAPILVFVNQDALPVDDRWLELLIAPFARPDPPAAVQGGILEFEADELRSVGRRRFFWDSCGPRFYFTSESEGWIDRHGGIGFSTVNCAIARWAWEQVPFGDAAILEDKLWQKRAHERGWRIESVPEAAVWHTHDYGLLALAKRCASEGYGWRLVGESYPLRTALADLRHRSTWREWRRGLAGGEMRGAAERLFPIVRPLALWWGNRWATGIHS